MSTHPNLGICAGRQILQIALSGSFIILGLLRFATVLTRKRAEVMVAYPLVI